MSEGFFQHRKKNQENDGKCADPLTGVKGRHSEMAELLKSKETSDRVILLDVQSVAKQLGNEYNRAEVQRIPYMSQIDQFHEQGIQKIKRNLRRVFPNNSFEMKLNDPKLTGITIKMPFEPYNYQKESIEVLVKGFINNNSTILFESPTGTGKTQTLITSIMSYNQYLESKGAKSRKVLYFTRTVSQMNQVIDEIKKSHFNISATVMASRNHLCINRTVLASKSGSGLESLCHDAQKRNACQYKAFTRKPKQSSNAPAESRFLMESLLNDIEDLRYIGSSCKVCPYYYSKSIANFSEVVVLAYNYLTDRRFRSTIQELIDGSFIVFDEAHNIIRVLEEASSYCFEFRTLEKCCEELRIMLERKGNGTDAPAVSGLQEALKYISGFEARVRQFALSNPRGEILIGDKALDLIGDVYCGLESVIAAFEQNTATESLLLALVQLGKISQKNKNILSSYRIYLNERSLNLVCLDASLQFEDILGMKPECVILTSGTLTPFENIEKQLNRVFSLKHSAKVETGSWQKKLGVVTLDSLFRFNNSEKIVLNFKNRGEEVLLRSFFSFLEELVKVIPQGILIFLPSYALLEQYRDFLNRDPIIASKIGREKKFFFESNSRHFRPLFESYKTACQGKGGVFFVVFGGKFSEGVDFKDELARLVIILGLPFSNYGDLRIQAKKSFLEGQVDKGERDSSQNKKLSFYEWYNYEMMLSVNQAIGRVKRHERDFGIVLLIDSRFTESRFAKLLSTHSKELNRRFAIWEELRAFCSDFFNRNTSELKLEPTVPKKVSFGELTTEQDTDGGVVELPAEELVECSICYDPFDGKLPFMMARCGHIACKTCWKHTLNVKLECPICKTRTRIKQLKSVSLK